MCATVSQSAPYPRTHAPIQPVIRSLNGELLTGMLAYSHPVLTHFRMRTLPPSLPPSLPPPSPHSSFFLLFFFFFIQYLDHIGAHSLDRLAIAFGAKTSLPVAFSLVNEFFQREAVESQQVSSSESGIS